MGSMYRALCPCGYHADRIVDGVGFSDVPHSPAICKVPLRRSTPLTLSLPSMHRRATLAPASG